MLIFLPPIYFFITLFVKRWNFFHYLPPVFCLVCYLMNRHAFRDFDGTNIFPLFMLPVVNTFFLKFVKNKLLYNFLLIPAVIVNGLLVGLIFIWIMLYIKFLFIGGY
jgi:hypothetical protein